MPNNKKSLPVFGIGPIYVYTCMMLTIGALALDYYGFLDMGKVTKGKTIMFAIGVILIIIGILLWVKAVIFQKITEEIKKGHLVTTGVYSIVRNPIYSAVTFIFTGLLLMSANLYLLTLPFVFWVYLTLLMKFTEEKWLKEKFGEEYVKYCQKVNRVIPWFRKI